MAVKYKDLVDAGRDGTIREITEYEMIHGIPEGYDALERYSPYQPDQVSDRGNWGVGDNAFMSAEDYNTLKGYQNQWFDAQAANDQAGMDAAHEAAQQLRYKYGYSGGADGSLYKSVIADVSGMEDEDEYAGWTISPAGSGGYGTGGFNSQYQARIDALLNDIMGRQPFSYNKDTDPLYQQYKDSYTKGAKLSMQDVLGEMSARTGGLASSYAQGVSQQAYNNHMAQLADKVPELYQLAYSMYMDELEQDRMDLDTLMGLDDRDFGRYTNERDFNYGSYRDSVSDSQWQQQFDYQKQQDALAQQNWQTQWDYQVQQDALDRAAASIKGSGGGRGSSSAAAISDLQAIYGMRNEADAYDYLVNKGFSASEVENYLNYWRQNRYSKENNAVQSPAEDDYVSVPNYGKITFDQAERLEEQGAIVLVGMQNGKPVYSLPADRNKNNKVFETTK